MDNDTQFFSNLFEKLCPFSSTNKSTAWAYHLQTDGQNELLSKTIIAKLQQHVPKHRQNWEVYFQPLTYAWNAQVPRSTNLKPF